MKWYKCCYRKDVVYAKTGVWHMHAGCGLQFDIYKIFLIAVKILGSKLIATQTFWHLFLLQVHAYWLAGTYVCYKLVSLSDKFRTKGTEPQNSVELESLFHYMILLAKTRGKHYNIKPAFCIAHASLSKLHCTFVYIVAISNIQHHDLCDAWCDTIYVTVLGRNRTLVRCAS